MTKAKATPLPTSSTPPSFLAAALEGLPVHITSAELGATFRCGLETLKAWADQGLLPQPERVGWRWLWSRDAIREHLARLQAHSF